MQYNTTRDTIYVPIGTRRPPCQQMCALRVKYAFSPYTNNGSIYLNSANIGPATQMYKTCMYKCGKL